MVDSYRYRGTQLDGYSPPRRRTVDEMTPDDIQRKAESQIRTLQNEIDQAAKRIPEAKKELEYWRRIAGL